MPKTAKRHFDEDISRAKNIFLHAKKLLSLGPSEKALANDLMLSAVALSVGAMDAYLCDAYVDCLSKALRAYYLKSWPGLFPSAYKKQTLPAGEVLKSTRTSRPLWSIRMAARKVMERENILSISKVEDLFNPVLPAGHKIWGDFIAVIIKHKRKRLTKYTPTTIAGLTGKALDAANKAATATFKRRISSIIQLRHDWIHNCSRPKVAITKITKLQTFSAIRDIDTFICELDTHIENYRVI